MTKKITKVFTLFCKSFYYGSVDWSLLYITYKELNTFKICLTLKLLVSMQSSRNMNLNDYKLVHTDDSFSN